MKFHSSMTLFSAVSSDPDFSASIGSSLTYGKGIREETRRAFSVSCKLAKSFKRTGLGILLFMPLVLLLRTLFSQIAPSPSKFRRRFSFAFPRSFVLQVSHMRIH